MIVGNLTPKENSIISVVAARQSPLPCRLHATLRAVNAGLGRISEQADARD